jgi:hypothetical protein
MSNAASRISVASLANAGIFCRRKRRDSGKRRLRRCWPNTKNETPITNLLLHHAVHVAQKERVAPVLMLIEVTTKIGSGQSGNDIHNWLDLPPLLLDEDGQDLKAVLSKH